MRYVSAYRNSASYQAYFRILPILMVLIPLGIFLAALADNPTPEQRRDLLNVIPILTVVLVFFGIVMRAGFRRQSGVTLEIDEQGIHHFAPGKPRTLLWKDILDAKAMRVGKREKALRLRVPGFQYFLPQHLVPDSPEAPAIIRNFGRPYWVYPDGRREPTTIETSVGYQLVQRYRPDLLPPQVIQPTA